MGHGEGLARPGDPEQHLLLLVTAQPGDQILDRLGLVPCWAVIRRQLELGSRVSGWVVVEKRRAWQFPRLG
jgi:hypothetical protein